MKDRVKRILEGADVKDVVLEASGEEMVKNLAQDFEFNMEKIEVYDEDPSEGWIAHAYDLRVPWSDFSWEDNPDESKEGWILAVNTNKEALGKELEKSLNLKGAEVFNVEIDGASDDGENLKIEAVITSDDFEDKGEVPGADEYGDMETI